MPQLWKSTKVAFGNFFLMISTSCLDYSELGIIQVIPSSRLCRVNRGQLIRASVCGFLRG